MTVDGLDALEILEGRVRAILPEEYQDSYEDVQPVPMRSAGLKYGIDGRVAWAAIWGSFCDLAMAGGPPHKGALLGPASQRDIDAQPHRYREVIDEICRGITMVTGLAAQPSPVGGWVRVTCESEGMAGWLLRAIVMENVAARAEGATLDLPASPSYRLEKEIKNVITVIAKTCHYWTGHMWQAQHREITDLFAGMAVGAPLIEPAPAGTDIDALTSTSSAIATAIHERTDLPIAEQRYAEWLGIECPTVRAAVWMMRLLVASNILSRREGQALYVPVNPVTDPGGETVVRCVMRVHGFAIARGII
jgi:hypothetical protein